MLEIEWTETGGERLNHRFDVCKLSTDSGESIADIELRDDHWYIYFNNGQNLDTAFRSFKAAKHYVYAMYLESEVN
jgi:hypothetical protein|tara:strand:- start:128 stop:355 length:228 start_codon:yes stop_codon:yes gene_type:complete